MNQLSEQMMRSWSLGHFEREQLQMDLLSAPADDRGYDWVSARVSIAVGGFTGSTDLMVMASDLKRFHAELEPLYRDLKGQAEFKTIEEQLYIKVTTDGLGHMTATGYVKDDLVSGNRLSFTIAFDQTFLYHTVRELADAVYAMEQHSG
jgi:hypothetical protein